jgi:hypothetical protein
MFLWKRSHQPHGRDNLSASNSNVFKEKKKKIFKHDPNSYSRRECDDATDKTEHCHNSQSN